MATGEKRPSPGGGCQQGGGRLLIQGGRVYTPRGPIDDGYVLIDGRRIVEIGSGPGPVAPVANILDARGFHVLPGFIDVHIHGAGGADVVDGTQAALETIARHLAEHGTTSFLATVITSPVDTARQAVEAVRSLRETPWKGARIVGVHLEGPFLNAKRKGMHDPALLRMPDVSLLGELVGATPSPVRLVTLAPELPGAPDLIRWLIERGIRVSAGHTDATYGEMLAAFGAGVRHATHAFNAMRGLHHREPGALGAALDDDRVTCELIADGLHVHEAAMRLLWRAKGPGGICLVTDLSPAAHLAPGTYDLGGTRVVVDERGCWLPDGTLASSVHPMNVQVRRFLQACGVGLEVAIEVACANPAKAAGVWHERGSLEPGKLADVIVVRDDLDVQATVVEGTPVFCRK